MTVQYLIPLSRTVDYEYSYRTVDYSYATVPLPLPYLFVPYSFYSYSSSLVLGKLGCRPRGFATISMDSTHSPGILHSMSIETNFLLGGTRTRMELAVFELMSFF